MDVKEQLEFFDLLLLRAPIYSFEEYNPARIQLLITDLQFRNALYLASPEFYQVLERRNYKWTDLDEKARFTLMKYYNRMSFRPTPFGAFSSVSPIYWGDQSQIRISAITEAEIHLLPSRSWQAAMEQRQQLIGNDLLVRTNPTLFLFGNMLRFIRAENDSKGKLQFTIAEVKADKMTRYITDKCRQPLLRSALVNILSELSEVSETEILQYAKYLIDIEVLHTVYQGSLITEGNWKENPRAVNTEDNLWKPLENLLFSDSLQLPSLAGSIKDKTGQIDALDQKSIFYAGLERKVQNGSVSNSLQQELLAAVTLLRKIVIPYPTPALEDFKKAFRIKFDAQRIPLLEALDPDIGIGYSRLHTSPEPEELLDGLNFQAGSPVMRPLDWTSVHRLFLKIWIRNPHRSFYEPVIIDDEELKNLDDNIPQAAFPPSLAVMFSSTDNGILLENIGGATGLYLTGRFSAFSAEIASFCKAIAQTEIAANPSVLFAEIHQLSDIHVDNVSRRVPLYDYVIPINAFSMEDGQQELTPDDLVLSVQGEEIILESLSKGKRVIPRLPTAYNFRLNDLAIFQMLCDLQFQGLQANLTFDMAKLFPGLDFYPRVQFRNTIIYTARWNLSEADVRMLITKPFSLGRLHQYRQRRVIPEQITMGLSDQQLIFNLVNDNDALFFLECLAEPRSVTLREYLPPDKKVSASGKALAAQYITVLKNSVPVYQENFKEPQKLIRQLKRNFPPGSEWFYVKIYCTPESADKVLIRVIAPFMKAQNETNLQWFFIRYADPEPHLRLRVLVKSPEAKILCQRLLERLSAKIALPFIREIKLETYTREIERYSPELIEIVEQFFCAGSDLVVSMLTNSNCISNDKMQQVPFYMVWVIVRGFIEPMDDCTAFFKWRSESFFKEFGELKRLRVGMDRIYRKIKSSLESMLIEAENVPLGIKPGKFSIYTEKMCLLAAASKQWQAEKRLKLLADLIHMEVNRMHKTKQRQHEALICYCLFKLSASLAARK